MKRELDGRYKKNVDSGNMSHLKLDLPLKAYKKTEPDESEGRSVIGNIIDIKEVRKLIAEKKWRTLDGRIIPIKQMSISHIKNTINFLKGKSKFFDTDLPEAEKEMYHKLFQKEIINR